MKHLLKRWWLAYTKWHRLAWAAYDMLNPGAPPPPFKRPVMPRWISGR